MPLPYIDPDQPIAVDLETCDPELKETAPGFISNVGFVAGIAIKAKEGAWYIPIHHAEGNNYNEDEVVKWLNETLSGDTDKVFHNAQYDVGWLTRLGVHMRGKIFDTMLAAPLLDENRFSYQLDALGKTYVGEGKYEEALRCAVAEKFSETRVRKVTIRLKENSPCNDYQPFIDAKTRVSPFYDLWPASVQSRYTVLGNVVSKSGQKDYKVPTRLANDVKALLWAVDPEEMGSYPVQDVELTYKLYNIFKKAISAEKLDKVMDMENELVVSLLEMREHGVRINMEKAVELDKQYSRTIDDIQKSINETAGFEVNVNASEDLVKLCEVLGLEYKKTSKGNPCFNADCIPDHSVFSAILNLREMFKARDTYIRGYIFGSTIDGWLHGQYNQLKSDEGGTVTGRLSSSSPNMQNLPNPKASQIGKDIRGLFLPDNDNEKWLSMDYSGQEPKMLVHTVLALDKAEDKIAKIKQDFYVPGANLARLEQFRGRSADFHTAVATICMKNEFEAMHMQYTEEDLKAAAKKFRPKAKSIGLGVMYGSGNQKVAEEMTSKGFPMTKDQAADIRKSIYDGVPFLSYLSTRLSDVAKSRGYIRTILGRRGRFPLWECPIWDKDFKEMFYGKHYNFKTSDEAWEWYRSVTEKMSWEDKNKIGRPMRQGTYKALNKYIQGSSADQTKMAMLHLYKRNNMNLNALDIYYRRIDGFVPPKFKTQVHDELNISLTKAESVDWYQDVMENCIPLEVEAVADPVVCDNWAEAK